MSWQLADLNRTLWTQPGPCRPIMQSAKADLSAAWRRRLRANDGRSGDYRCFSKAGARSARLKGHSVREADLGPMSTAPWYRTKINSFVLPGSYDRNESELTIRASPR
jgi:hypothetical protein